MNTAQNQPVEQNFPRIPKPLLYTLIALSFAAISANLVITFASQNQGFKSAYIDLTSPLWNLLVVAAFFYAAKKSSQYSRRTGLAWRIIAISQLCFTVGDVLWAYFEVGLGQSPFPSAADVFYLAQYPLLLLGILLLPGKRLKLLDWVKNLLDISIIMLSAVLILWNYLLGPLAAVNHEENLLVQSLSLAYPIGDLIMLCGILLLMYRQMVAKKPVALILLAVGTGFTILTDCIYGYQSMLGTYVSGTLIDSGWTISYVLFGWAGIWQACVGSAGATGEQETTAEDRLRQKIRSNVAIYFPYLWIILAYLLLVRSHYWQAPLDFSWAAVIVGGVIALVLMRQLVTIQENHQLLKEQQDSNQLIRFQTGELRTTNQMLQREIEEHRRAEEKLAHDALHDALTGLPNRILFVDRLNHAIDLSKRYASYKYSVLFLDLDHFKVVNDSLGHSIGDCLLVEISQKLKSCLRDSDTVARLGGDEFVILLEDLSDLSEATNVVKRIQESLNAPIDLQGHLVFASASVGIVFNLTNYEHPDEVLQDADIAMYQAKTNGKAQFEIFKTSYRDQAIKRLELENDLRRALDRGEFELYYQPIVSLLNDEISGFEALIRWHHPVLGMLHPLDFISLAEETGLIIPIGYWVLAQACQQLVQWQGRYHKLPPLSINVNISERQLLDPTFVQHVDQIMREIGIGGKSLRLEITEKVCLERSDKVISTLEALQQMGIQLHIDDFGTGYSSLSYLQYFPIQTIKIDRSFISGINSSENDRNIVQTIISLAKHLHMETIAEGVETEEQKNAVIDLGCSYGQGFLMSRPLTAQKAEAFLSGE